ncbi:MAG: hypothetical protein Q7S86_01590 [bacterium]|nr:hypothetical protein [bacterium]
MNSESSIIEDGVAKEITLKQERSLADQIASVKSGEVNPERIESRIAALLLEKPKVTLELFREVWRRYIQAQLGTGRTFQEIWKSVVDLDNAGREGLGPDVPVEEMYERLDKALMTLNGDSPGAVTRIIREVVLEFKPKRVSR